MNRACIFVDGENFRFTLKDLFPDARYTFRKSDYLPQTDWHHFFTSLANRFDCELLRTYWYVTEHIDCRPYRIPSDWDSKERVFARWYRSRIRACSEKTERREVLAQIEQELHAARLLVEARARPSIRASNCHSKQFGKQCESSDARRLRCARKGHRSPSNGM